MSNKVRIPLRIPRWLRDRIKEQADYEAESINRVITDILRDKFQKDGTKVTPLSHISNDLGHTQT